MKKKLECLNDAKFQKIKKLSKVLGGGGFGTVSGEISTHTHGTGGIIFLDFDLK